MMIRYLPIVVAAVLLAGGCGKKDDPNTVGSPSPLTRPAVPPSADTPAPPLPQADAGKSAELPLPQPGQANDHSSPAFKAGGLPDKKQ